MWRRFGARAYATLTLAVFTVQAVALVLLTWAFTFDRLRMGNSGFALREALMLALAVTAMGVMVLTGYTLGYQALSTGRLARERHEAKVWRDRWLGVLFAQEPRPTGDLSAAAVEALVNVREKLTGSDAEQLDRVIQSGGVAHDLIAVATGARRYSLARRLDALDLLSRAGSATGFDELSALTRDPEMAIRVMAVRALARATGSLEGHEARELGAMRLVEILHTTEVPAGAVEEAYLVLGPAATEVLRTTITSGGRADLLTAALDAAGRLHCADLTPPIVAHLDSEISDVRCAAWRAIDGIGVLPPEAEPLLIRAMEDPEPHVRGQAVRVARLLPGDSAIPRLNALLGDSSWWVRKAAAKSLVEVGAAGVSALRAAGESHPDRFARHIAVHVLVETNEMRPGQGAEMRAAAG